MTVADLSSRLSTIHTSLDRRGGLATVCAPWRLARFFLSPFLKNFEVLVIGVEPIARASGYLANDPQLLEMRDGLRDRDLAQVQVMRRFLDREHDATYRELMKTRGRSR